MATSIHNQATHAGSGWLQGVLRIRHTTQTSSTKASKRFFFSLEGASVRSVLREQLIIVAKWIDVSWKAEHEPGGLKTETCFSFLGVPDGSGTKTHLDL